MSERTLTLSNYIREVVYSSPCFKEVHGNNSGPDHGKMTPMMEEAMSKQEVTLDYTMQNIGGCYTSARTITDRTQADKMVADYLRNLLPIIYVDVNVHSGDNHDTYKYILEPEEYAVMLLQQTKKHTLKQMKESLNQLVQQLEEYDEEEEE